jgi:phosphoribosylamine--glycine ligase
MGALAPSPILTPAIREQVIQRVIIPTLKGMREEGCPFVGLSICPLPIFSQAGRFFILSSSGVLYIGLMVQDNGEFNVLEYNCRLGDPETQVIFYVSGVTFLLISSFIGDSAIIIF